MRFLNKSHSHSGAHGDLSLLQVKTTPLHRSPFDKAQESRRGKSEWEKGPGRGHGKNLLSSIRQDMLRSLLPGLFS